MARERLNQAKKKPAWKNSSGHRLKEPPRLRLLSHGYRPGPRLRVRKAPDVAFRACPDALIGTGTQRARETVLGPPREHGIEQAQTTVQPDFNLSTRTTPNPRISSMERITAPGELGHLDTRGFLLKPWRGMVEHDDERFRQQGRMKAGHTNLKVE
jgi:hypothetical protein